MNLKMKFAAAVLATLQVTTSVAQQVDWGKVTDERLSELAKEKQSNPNGGYAIECGSSAEILEWANAKDIGGYQGTMKAVKAMAKVVGSKDYGADYDEKVVRVVAPYTAWFAGVRDKNPTKYASTVNNLKQIINACNSRLLSFMTPSETARAQGKLHVSIDPVREIKGKLGAECVGAANIILSQPTHKNNPSLTVMDSVNKRAIHQTYKNFDVRQDAKDFITMHMGGIQMVTMARSMGDAFYQERMDHYRKVVLSCNKSLDPITDDTALMDFLTAESKSSPDKLVALSCVGSANFLLTREFGNARANIKGILDKATVAGNLAYGSNSVFSQKAAFVTSETMKYSDTIQELNPSDYQNFIANHQKMLGDCVKWKPKSPAVK